jgi:hypothetical protein
MKVVYETPLIRSHTRIDYKRCPKKWYWRWLLGLIPIAKTFGALDLGNWVHDALARWYVIGRKRKGKLLDHFNSVSNDAIDSATANNVPEHELLKATELQFLGQALMQSYVERYGRDSNVEILEAEIPLEFPISDEQGKIIAQHKLKPDAVFRDLSTGYIWLFEHKTAATIQTTHLVIDDQARPYTAMAQPALRKAKVIRPDEEVRGIMYNFIRKAFPDTRKTNEKGHYLNLDGTVSKKQPPAYFLRHPLTVGSRAKAMTLRRLRNETVLINLLRKEIIDGSIDPKWIPKTPHRSCPKFCEFFKMCQLEEEGADITDMQRALYIVQDPYQYDEETTDEPASFELA